VFLNAADFSTIIHPLPLYSTLASDLKWVLSLVYIVVSLVLVGRLLMKNKSSHSGES
jgi:hypothetical protein